MQKSLNIPTTNKKTIFGTLDTPKGKSKGLIIFVHGLTGHQNEHIFFNGAKYFNSKGYSVYRFNLYGGEKNARQLEDTSLKEHIQDVETVVKYFKKEGNQKIFFVGHSLGAIAIIEAKIKNISGIILRDPAFNTKGSISNDLHHKNKTYILDRGIKYIIGEKMYHDLTYTRDHMKDIKDISFPIKIICAGYGDNIREKSKIYYQGANKPKAFSIIPKAFHCFDEEGTEEKLFAETYKRVKKYS
ncbi:MAG: alpha/beta hydrolase [candidate division SR1 bacterium]|nr:alpha/beta hydrolase [candidate division SR1 bacterium]